jgi:hypothetical protein
MEEVRAREGFDLSGAGSEGSTLDREGTLTDEEAARNARDQFRESGLPLLEPDEDLAAHLVEGEQLLGIRERASLGRIDEALQAAVRDEGSLYVTNQRLLHIGSEVTSVPLSEIDELAMADDRILVTLAGATGVTLDVPYPRHLRVLIAAAKSAARA